MSIRVFLVDDHPVFRAGLRFALESADGLEVVGEAASGEEAVGALRLLDPPADVVVMDLQMPGGSGIEATRLIRAQTADDDTAPQVLILSVAEDDHSVVTALRAGAHGFLVKLASRQELIRAIHVVAEGGAVFGQSVAARLEGYFSALHVLPSRAAFPELTERERQILDLLARGYNNRKIARDLVLAEKTVRNHITQIYMKLGVNDRMAAAVRARDAGLGE
ncbi:response regulator [Nonomuraea typhae]|uniref:Response regulator n=1 Tax=Nonomuraea typhae TaxID=2603600 RepID=A0ABW7Z9D0_9ACTN